MRFDRTGRLVIKPKSVYTPVKQSVKHVLVEDNAHPENNIDGDNDTDQSKKNDQAGISKTTQSSSHAHKKQKYYYRYHMHPCRRTATTEDDTVQRRKDIRRI